MIGVISNSSGIAQLNVPIVFMDVVIGRPCDTNWAC